MKSSRCSVSSCGRCRFYAPEGRRGGQCDQLGVPVQSRWQPCPLAVPVFMTPLVEIAPLDFLPQPLERSLSEVMLKAALLESALEAPDATRHGDQTFHSPVSKAPVSR